MLSLKHLSLFIKNNLLQLQRKWLSLPLLILFPLFILLLIATIAITVLSPSEEEPIQVGLIDLDHSEETQMITRIITESSPIGSFIHIHNLSETEAKEMLEKDQLSVYITFPENFTSNLYNGESVNISMVANPKRVTESLLIKELIDSMARHIRVAQANILTINYFAKQLPIDQKARNDLLFEEFKNFLFYTLGKDMMMDHETVENLATATPVNYYGLASWFIIMMLWMLIFYHILHQDETKRMRERMKLYGVTRFQQLFARMIVTLGVTGILSTVAFIVLKRILVLDLITEDYWRIGLIILLHQVIFLECMAILELIIRSRKLRILGQSLMTLFFIFMSGAIIPTLYFPMNVQKWVTYLFSNHAFHWMQEVILQGRFFVDYIPLLGTSMAGILLLLAISHWKERIH